jgi:hypothetical protein
MKRKKELAMTEPTDPQAPRSRIEKEYEDPHYHDDEGDVVPADDVTPHGPRPPLKRTPARKLPPRRHYEED